MDDLELRLQRVLDRVELVEGAGDPGAGMMCVMSLVARLAGEGHTDDPRCASPVIRAFAVPVNDGMPREVRRRLKPFAPRILGTDDGLDRERAAVLRRALAEEILPRVAERHRLPSAAAPAWRGDLVGRLWSALRGGRLRRRVGRLVERVVAAGRPGDEVALARAAGRLIALCAGHARSAREAEWYWDAAIGLLDGLCDVGGPRFRGAPAELRVERLALLEASLRPARVPARPAAMLSRSS
jgi:hypothetical protein